MLVDISPIENENVWNISALEQFSALLVDDPTISTKSKFKLVIHHHIDDKYSVVLFKIQGSKQLCINTALVKAEVAQSTGVK